MKKRANVWWFIWIVILGIAFVVRVENISFGLPQRLHPDEWSQVEVAWRMANGDWNPHFFRYPAGHMTFLALLFRLWLFFYNPSLSDLYLFARWVSVIYGTLCVGLAGLWAAQLWHSRLAGLVAGLIITFSWTLIEQSHYAVVDMPLTFWSGVALYAISQVPNKTGWLGLAAISIGMAISSKYTAILLLLPYFLSYWCESKPRNIISFQARYWIPRLLIGTGLVGLGLCLGLLLFQGEILNWFVRLTSDGHLETEYIRLYNQFIVIAGLVSSLLMILAGLIWHKPTWQIWASLFRVTPFYMIVLSLIIFGLVSPFTFIEWRQSTQDFFYEYRHMQLGSAAHYVENSPLYDQLRSSVSPPNFINYSAQFTSEWGWLIIALVGLGSFALLRLRPGFALSLILYLIIYMMIICKWANFALRYALLLYIPLAVFAAGGLLLLRKWLRLYLHKPHWEIVGSIILILAIIWMPVYSSLSSLAVFCLPDTREIAYTWILNNLPASAYLAYDSFTPDFQAETLPYKTLGVPSYVLYEFRSAQLLENGIDFVVTSYNPEDKGTTSFVKPEDWHEFTENYDLMQEFIAQSGSFRGRSIWIYQRKSSN